MSSDPQPLLVMFFGPPGSGKSYFARALAKELHAVRLNGDSMRMSIFGSRQETDRIYASGDRNILNSYVFNGLNYVTEQILLSGNDVVYDANHNKRSDREELEVLAAKYGARPVLVWIQTPVEVALQRSLTREETLDTRRHTQEQIRASMSRHEAVMDEPSDAEQVITINGELPFEEQFVSFRKQLDALSQLVKETV